MVTREVGGKPRRVCPECRHVHFVEPRVGVGVCVVEAGRILLVQRAFSPEKGKWSLPAGYLDHGEDPERHAVVEVREETGLEVRVTSLMGVFHNPPEQGGATVFILYRGQRLGGDLVPGDDARAAMFFARDALPELAFASTRHAVSLL
jgi:ADP-ribose pyrophosphatase YjhB (NUDIX family)